MFRPELHGLRGLAIALVVVYHVWFGRVSGGVDVFLFLSAFLLTGTFLRRAEAGEPLRPITYWARTFTRLLPPTVLVALATLLGVRFLLPPDRLMPAITDALGAVGQVENWVLITRGVDYYAARDTGPSPFQHFWSLSVQGQVFLLWPLLIALAVGLARFLRRRPAQGMAVLFMGVFAASLTWSVLSTAAQQEIAYFDTTARLWEFAAGSLLALVLPGIERRARATPWWPRLRLLLGWGGLVALVSCGALLDVRGGFPGWIALWPLGAAALVLLAGSVPTGRGADRLLTTAPARFIGDISYALYLVHWPLLILTGAMLGTPRPGLWAGSAIIAASVLLAWLLTRLLDTPVRRSPWIAARLWRRLAVIVLCLAVGLSAPFAWRMKLLALEEEAAARATADNPGARVLDPAFTPHPDRNPNAPTLPTWALVGKDWVAGSERCTGALAPREEAVSSLCRTVPGGESAPVIVSVGNSRMEQFSGALIELAQRNGWTLVTLWKGGCVYAPDASVSAECDAFSRDAAAYIARVQPDAIALQTTFMDHDGREQEIGGLQATLTALDALPASPVVIAARDIPRLASSPTACAQEKGEQDPACTLPAPPALVQERPDAATLRSHATAVPVDTNALICPEGACPAVVGNVVVWIDRDHISGEYARSLQGAVDEQLADGGFAWQR